MSTIITRNSANSGSVPSSLVQGELAINVTDNRLFFGSGSGNVVKEFGVTASYALQALSSSYAETASYAPDYLPLTGGTINGDVIVNGTASIAFLNVTYESASVIYSSGSNQFGDALNDTQTLWGTVDVKTGPVLVTGSVIANSFTGSLLGTASYATNALSASYAPSTPAFPYTGSALITGSLGITGSLSNGSGNIASGIFSHAEGQNTTSTGESSHAEGKNTTSTGSYSHAEGSTTTAIGNASHAEGESTTSTGNFSHAEGQNTITSGSYSHAEGSTTTAIGNASHAEGVGTTSTGEYSHAEGQGTISTGDASHAEGKATTSIGGFSHAEGINTQAIGGVSHAEGASTQTGTQLAWDSGISSGIVTINSSYGDVSLNFAANGTLLIYDEPFDSLYGKTTTQISQSLFDGTNTIVELYDVSITTTQAYVGDITQGIENWTGNQTIPGDFSHAEGFSTISIGNYSHAEGSYTRAIGNSSHAEGVSTQAIGDYSHAEGEAVQAIGGASHAEGFNTVALGNYQHVQGQYNISSSSPSAFILGNGTADNARSNLIFASGSQVQITGSVIATSGFTGSLQGTASYATNALSASYALSSSYSLTSSYSDTSISASHAIYADTASFSDRTTQIDVYVLNQSGQSIAKGVVVRITGSNTSSDIPRIVTASYINDGNSANTLGITTTAIANGAEGYVVTEGILKGINTQAFTSGQLIYLGATGSIIGTAPQAPLHTVRLGEVIRHQSNNGSIYVRIDNGYELEELHDVLITSASSGDLLICSGSVWINSKQLSGSYGLTGSLTATSFTGSLLGTATTASYVLNAVSASFASTASYVQTAQTASYVLNAVSASFASTVPASGVIGLNLSQIATGSVTASVSPTQFTVTSGSSTEFTVSGTSVTIGNAITDTHFITGSARITGSLIITGSITQNISTASFGGIVGIGTSTPAARLDVIASSSAAADTVFRVRNSANTLNFAQFNGDGTYTISTAGATLTDAFSRISDGRMFMAKGGGNFIELNPSTTANRIYAPSNGWDLTGNTSISTQAAGSNTGTGTFYFYAGNLQIGTGIAASSNASMSIWMSNGTAPSSNTTGRHWYYSANRNGVAGKASPHFRTEDGTVIWLGDESRLFNVTASRTIISSSQNTISGSSLTVYGSGSTQPVFTVQGSQGELFSVTDNLSGSLFSVNDISGLPILEVFSDNTTLIGNYLDPMLITTAKVTQTNSGSFVMYSLPTASYDTAFFEYSVKSGSNARAGTIMAIQSGSAVNFTETTTTDFGSTSAISFTVVVTGSNMALTGSSSAGSWTIKTIVRGL